MRVLILALLLSGCSSKQEEQEVVTKFPNVPTYGIVIELQKEEEKWNNQK